jgi:trypsin-like peptidase
VIGDGTLIVTAHHIVFEVSEKGQHKMAGLVSVVSPYLGEVTDAEIIAADSELDLVVLKVPWKDHPALNLATEEEIFSAERTTIIGMPDIIRCLDPDSEHPLSEDCDVNRANTFVDFVAVRQHKPLFIELTKVIGLGHGWSGSPMLLPEKGPFRGTLAHTLEKTGDLTEAEKHFRELLNIEPNNPVVHMWLAKFLAKYRPHAKKEALKEAQTALTLPAKRGLPRQVIEQFISNLKSQIGQDSTK